MPPLKERPSLQPQKILQTPQVFIQSITVVRKPQSYCFFLILLHDYVSSSMLVWKSENHNVAINEYGTLTSSIT